MDISKKIESLRSRFELTQKELGEIAGVTGASISAWELGERSPKLGAIKRICAHFGIDLTRFADDGNDYFGQDDFLPTNMRPLAAGHRVPRLGRIACGEPVLAEENYDGYDDVPDWIVCDFTLVCKGDSMTGAHIRDGDIVCIRQQEEVENGQIAAIRIDGEFESEATLKRVRFVDGGVALWPENPAYAPMIFTGENVNKVHIIGLATHFIARVR